MAPSLKTPILIILGSGIAQLLHHTNLLSQAKFFWRASKTALGPGDGREQRLLEYVLSSTPAGNASAVVEAMDDYAWHKEWYMSVGDQKGQILDAAIASAKSTGTLNILELGTYCAYGAIRMIANGPDNTHLYTVETQPATADLAEKMIAHAGLSHRISVLRGRLEDVLKQEPLLSLPPVNAVFIDHDKRFYVPDLKLLIASNKLSHNAVVVADNLLIPGAPEYIEYMTSSEGKEAFDTNFVDASLEYTYLPPSLGFKDQVAVSTFKGWPATPAPQEGEKEGEQACS